MYYLQSAFQEPLLKQFDCSHVWNQRLKITPIFTEELKYCHQFEKTLDGKYKYVKTLNN